MAKGEPVAKGGPPKKREPRPPADPERRIAFRFGLSAESRAAAFLIAKGYRILFRRFRTPVGEIDIVARRRGVLVFVEVKARERLDDAAEAIGKRQQGRIIAAAEFWLAGHPEDAMGDMRFDVVLVAPGRLPLHLPGAFDASM
jgi:putative endonuclease